MLYLHSLKKDRENKFQYLALVSCILKKATSVAKAKIHTNKNSYISNNTNIAGIKPSTKENLMKVLNILIAKKLIIDWLIM